MALGPAGGFAPSGGSANGAWCVGMVFGHRGQQTPGVVISFSELVSIMKRSWLKDLEEFIKLLSL